MAKHSKRSRCRMQQSGLGSGLCIRSRNPVRVRALPTPVTLDAATEFRLRCVEHARAHGVPSAVRVFHRSRATVYRWLRRDDPDDLRSLQPRSRRPKTTQKRQWTAAQEQAVLRIRILLEREGMPLSASAIGRILASLHRRRLLIEPRAVRMRRSRPIRPHATRVPKDKRTPTTPGELIQLDTVHVHPVPGIERRQFTAVDVVSRYGVFGVRSPGDGRDRRRVPRRAHRPDALPGAGDPGRWRIGVHGRVRDRLPGAGDRRLCPAAPLTDAEWASRTAQWDEPAGVLGGLRRSAGPPEPDHGPSTVRNPIPYGATTPGPRICHPCRLPDPLICLRCLEPAQPLDKSGILWI